MSNDNPTIDQIDVGDDDNGKPMEDNLKSRATWLRLMFMLIFCVVTSLALLVGSFVVALGFLWVLFTGQVNPELRATGQSFATYIYQIARYLTFNSDTKPFPFGEKWPSADLDE
ncbi:MAG: DUF4389 domain-containing protein [Gammaproteobacteria bacterium]|nr:DUF4389 domain-containing protein [Gammaproteobacteria bacterium]MDH3416926.1 DUF4389 domain-containing protein [Gammaproteobacteria bacterium]